MRNSTNLAGRFVIIGMSALLLTTAVAGFAQSQVTHFVVKDSRGVGERSVRFAGAQGTENAPNIVLLGGNEAVWPKIRGAVARSEANGYPVRAILVGPVSAPPALEIYAKGANVTNPINPYTITQGDLMTLIRDIHREYYPR